MARHLPATPAELQTLGWDCVDVLLVTGDANVDHPSFPAALLGRVLEAAGFRVALVARPDPGDPEALRAMGPPRLFLGVTAGSLDSMVANYTAQRKRRSDDPHDPDGKAGHRPDRALTAWCNLGRRAFGKETLIVAGGLEASLRRFAHYDYWSDSVRRPILMDCGADILVAGMGEAVALELARRLEQRSEARAPASDRLAAVRDLPGVVWRQPAREAPPPGAVALPRHEEVASDRQAHLRAFQLQEANPGRAFAQECGGMRVVANAPPPPPSPEALEAIYALPFTRNAHPLYGNRTIAALEQVRFSVTSHRGCAGGCAFCSIVAHQGKGVVSRGRQSVLDEVRTIARHPDFRGTVNDIGGPTANMWGLRCTGPDGCRRTSCLWPRRCSHLVDEQDAYRQLLADAAAIPGVKNLFVTTGIRMDLALDNEALVEALAFRHTSGHLKVAPEHVVPSVLQAMRKPADDAFGRFLAAHRRLSRRAGRNQYVLPYLLAAHPGCRLEDMVELALYLRRRNIRAEQCQIFTPTPGTAATVMYATGLDPATGEPLFVERDPRTKELHKALILWHLPAMRPQIRQALKRCNRMDAAHELLG
jgi:uncharacterized radical SAM protein YgiQ